MIEYSFGVPIRQDVRPVLVGQARRRAEPSGRLPLPQVGRNVVFQDALRLLTGVVRRVVFGGSNFVSVAKAGGGRSARASA